MYKKLKAIIYFLGVIVLGFGFGVLHASYFIGVEKLFITGCVLFSGLFCWLSAESSPQISENKTDILSEEEIKELT